MVVKVVRNQALLSVMLIIYICTLLTSETSIILLFKGRNPHYKACQDHPYFSFWEARDNLMSITLETTGGVLSTLNPSEDTLVIAPAPL